MFCGALIITHHQRREQTTLQPVMAGVKSLRNDIQKYRRTHIHIYLYFTTRSQEHVSIHYLGPQGRNYHYSYYYYLHHQQQQQQQQHRASDRATRKRGNRFHPIRCIFNPPRRFNAAAATLSLDLHFQPRQEMRHRSKLWVGEAGTFG